MEDLMFPIEFDHTILDSLPFPDKNDTTRVLQILKAIISRRVIPYFRRSRGTDPLVARRVVDRIKITRLEDFRNRIRAVSLLALRGDEWNVMLHERLFDYLAFVIPSHPESPLAAGTPEERKMLAFMELVLRHQVEHMLYPDSTEREVIKSDVDFAMNRRRDDPTFYRDLRRAFDDEMNGLKAKSFLALFDVAERKQPYEALIRRMLDIFVMALGDMPEETIRDIFPTLCTEVKIKLLGVCFRRSSQNTYPLLKRTSFLEMLLRLFILLINTDEEEARRVFDAFKSTWGLIYLFRELGLADNLVEEGNAGEIFEEFKEGLRRLAEEERGAFAPIRRVREAPEEPKEPAEPQVKSLTDRIEEARKSPTFPRRVMQLIDKNKLNAAGHSGYKYSELLETLLSINWGNFKKIDVTPEGFEEGLDRSHYGLHKPKQIICDFFANLIWRYQQFDEKDAASWKNNGSAFLFVGPPGVGKTSLAISIAENLRIPYHKLSLGGMKDEADLRGHGFTYEGSKPGAIVQGIIKMGIMNGMFILDEADKTDKVAIATLLEILDPEQNHLFHDKYTQSTIDIDLSNFHFILTANTLETVPPPVVNRCEVVILDHYSIEEKIAIAREHLIGRVRRRYQIGDDQIFIDPEEAHELLRYLVKTYTHEAGVRELERMIRTLFLRVFRKEILTGVSPFVKIRRQTLKRYLDPPREPRMINRDDRIGEMNALGVNVERGIGSIVPVQATPIRLGTESGAHPGHLSMIHATGNIERIMDESRKVAVTAILHCADELGISLDDADKPIHLHFMGASTPKDGPSAGGAIALALASVLSGREIRRDTAMTGEIDTQGRITGIGGLVVKLETAYDAGCKTVIIPRENLHGDEGIDRLPDALKKELQVLSYDEWARDHEPFDFGRHVLQIVAVDHIVEAARIAFIYEKDLEEFDKEIVPHARVVAESLALRSGDRRPPLCVLYAKDPQEFALDGRPDAFWDDRDCFFLVSPGAVRAVRETFSGLAEGGRIIDFSPSDARISTVLEDLILARGETPANPSLTAPFFFLQRDLKELTEFSGNDSVGELRLFANNYAVQGFKLKGCKGILNRVMWYLSQSEPALLRSCPFLGIEDGIYVLDLSFVPEKYRLDSDRAAKITVSCLTKWLTTVDASSKSGPPMEFFG
jgi:ATP-dependent Lon protease